MLSSIVRRIPCGDELTLPAEVFLPRGANAIVVLVDGLRGGRGESLVEGVIASLFDAGIGSVVLQPAIRQGSGSNGLEVGRRNSVIDHGVSQLLGTTSWLEDDVQMEGLGLGLMGSDIGVATAMLAAAHLGDGVQAVVSLSGRPDLAGEPLEGVSSPTCLIVAENNRELLAFNEIALDALGCEKELEVVPGATHLDESPEVLGEVARLASDWFEEHLSASR